MQSTNGTGHASLRPAGALVAAAALLLAMVGARSYPGGWNDASRLATVESLVDYQTWAIDRSVFAPLTSDKMFIGGRFYSDKSPVPALAMAGGYKLLQSFTGLTAREQPAVFCYAMTLATSGLAYVAAAWCLFQLAIALRLSRGDALLLAASLSLATIALPYTRHVNNHILLLGVVAALVLSLERLAQQIRSDGDAHGPLWPRLIWCGTLAGAGYTIDLGVGPVLLLATVGLVAYRCRSLASMAAFVVAAVPWLALHHVLNYAIGGTWTPASAAPQHFVWPGSPFNPSNMTGGWNHESLPRGMLYAVAMLLGKRGLVTHSLPLLLALPGFVLLWRRRSRHWPELLFATGLFGGTWLLYAAASNNYSGLCCSIRWFVPLLAPGYYVLAVLLAEHPRLRPDFLVLSAAGGLIGGLMWWHGPWHARTGAWLWPLVAAALAGWWWAAAKRRRVAIGPEISCPAAVAAKI